MTPDLLWQGFAACRDFDPEVFYPLDDRPDSLGVAAAKAVCASCPVVSDCLAFALRTGDAHGVFGGTTADERDRLRRRPARVLIAEGRARREAEDARKAAARQWVPCAKCGKAVLQRKSGMVGHHVRFGWPTGTGACPGTGLPPAPGKPTGKPLTVDA